MRSWPEAPLWPRVFFVLKRLEAWAAELEFESLSEWPAVCLLFAVAFPPVVLLSLLLSYPSMGSFRGFPSSKLRGREVTCLPSPVARDYRSLLHLMSYHLWLSPQ